MEYMTALKRPGHKFVDAIEKGVGYEIGQSSWKARLACRRLCSQALFVVVMLFLMLVLFASQLIVHVQMQELRKQSQENKDKMNDVLEAALLQKEQMDFHLSRLDHKLKHYRRRKRNHDVPTYAILRGKNERNLSNGIFKWSVIEDDRTIWVSEDMQHSISEEMVQVPYNGLYSISVRIKIEGRQHPSLTPFTPVGMSICKQGEYANGSTWNHTIDEVFLTQDDGGEIRSVYGGLAPNPPIDSLSYSNMIHLQRYDRIYVRVPESSLNDHSIQYNNKKEDSHLSIYLLLRD